MSLNGATKMTPTTNDDDDTALLLSTYNRIRQLTSSRLTDGAPTLPPLPSLTYAFSALPSSFPAPLGPSPTLEHILTTLTPALNNQSLSSRYYGFVTGGVLPVAEAADNIVSALDQNVQVNLPGHSAAPAIEDAALRMVTDVLDLGEGWHVKTFTTGATGSNVLGLACGREAVLARRKEGVSVADMGLLDACEAAGVKRIQVLTNMGHSSLSKAASVVGLGHRVIKEVGVSEEEPWRLDVDKVERELQREKDGVVSIIVVSAGEVNTGRFATGMLDMPKLRSLADKYGAWIHVDGAFGIFARVLPKTDEYLNLHAHVAGLELADSIAADAHKILNVPYDAGIFLCRDASIPPQVFQNPNAAYLAAPPGPGGTTIHSPLNIGLENSRRFRALPVYAVLLSEGRSGISSMVARMVNVACQIATFIRASPYYELLPDEEASLEDSFIIVLFRAKNPELNAVLVDRINSTHKMFVSGTKWKGEKACRIAVSNWRCDAEKDVPVVQEVLTSIAEAFSSS